VFGDVVTPKSPQDPEPALPRVTCRVSLSASTKRRLWIRWTNGFWDFGPGAQRKWNELQNTTRDIQLLTNYLLCE
jgi:hypothetical protein